VKDPVFLVPLTGKPQPVIHLELTSRYQLSRPPAIPPENVTMDDFPTVTVILSVGKVMPGSRHEPALQVELEGMQDPHQEHPMVVTQDEQFEAVQMGAGVGAGQFLVVEGLVIPAPIHPESSACLVDLSKQETSRVWVWPAQAAQFPVKYLKFGTVD